MCILMVNGHYHDPHLGRMTGLIRTRVKAFGRLQQINRTSLLRVIKHHSDLRVPPDGIVVKKENQVSKGSVGKNQHEKQHQDGWKTIRYKVKVWFCSPYSYQQYYWFQWDYTGRLFTPVRVEISGPNSAYERGIGERPWMTTGWLTVSYAILLQPISIKKYVFVRQDKLVGWWGRIL